MSNAISCEFCLFGDPRTQVIVAKFKLRSATRGFGHTAPPVGLRVTGRGPVSSPQCRPIAPTFAPLAWPELAHASPIVAENERARAAKIGGTDIAGLRALGRDRRGQRMRLPQTTTATAERLRPL